MDSGGKWEAGEKDERTREPDLTRYIDTLFSEREWRRNNAELWASEVEAWAVSEAAAGRRFSVQAAMERIRWKDRVDTNGKDVQVNDHFSPIWGRILVKLHPEVKPFLKMKKTPWDSPEIARLIHV